YKIKSERPEPRGLALVCRFKCSGCGRFVQRYHCGHGSAHKHEGKRRADNTKEQMMWLRPSTPHILCARPHTIFRSPHIPSSTVRPQQPQGVLTPHQERGGCEQT